MAFSPTPYLTTAEAADRCGFRYSSWLRMRARGLTPPPDAVVAKQARYLPETVDRWFADRGGKHSYRLQIVDKAAAVSVDESGEQAA